MIYYLMKMLVYFSLGLFLFYFILYWSPSLCHWSFMRPDLWWPQNSPSFGSTLIYLTLPLCWALRVIQFFNFCILNNVDMMILLHICMFACLIMFFEYIIRVEWLSKNRKFSETKLKFHSYEMLGKHRQIVSFRVFCKVKGTSHFILHYFE